MEQEKYNEMRIFYFPKLKTNPFFHEENRLTKFAIKMLYFCMLESEMSIKQLRTATSLIYISQMKWVRERSILMKRR